MDKDKLRELKSSIRLEYEAKINKLRGEMEAAISSLSSVEETFFDVKSSSASQSSLFTGNEGIRKIRIPKNIKRPSIPARLKAALSRMYGNFSRDDLFEKTNNDETGIPIPRGSLAPEFSKLIKNKEIIVVTEPRGPHKGVYKKALTTLGPN